MRHRKAHRKMGRSPSHIKAMRSNMLASLIEHRRINTTERKAKEIRSVAEKAVTRFTALGDLLLKDQDQLSQDEKARIIHAIRMVRRTLHNRDAMLTLFDEIAPRYLGRPGGYTRIYKTGFRKGDGARMAILEFIEADLPEGYTLSRETENSERKKGLFSRFRKNSESA